MAVAVPVKRRYRWFQFSLRTWLVATVILTASVGWWLQRGVRQKEAVEVLQAAGFQIIYDFEGLKRVKPAKKNQSKPASQIPQPLLKLLGTDFFHQVVGIGYSWQFRGLPLLTKDRMRPEVMKSFGMLRHLKSLDLRSFVDLEDLDLQTLGGLGRLEHLRLSGPAITDTGVKQLGKLTRLQSLSLNRVGITKRGAEVIANLRNLSSLNLEDADLTNDALAHIGRLKELKWLSLKGSTRVTDDGLRHLSDLAKLEVLVVDGPKITDAGLEHLAGLANLKTIHVGYDYHPSDDGRRRKLPPKCEIHWPGGIDAPRRQVQAAKPR